MTVKITERKLRTLKCEGCKSTIEFLMIADDLEGAYFEHDYTESGPEGVGVRCPDCKNLNQIHKAPQSLIEAVWSRKRRTST